MKRTLRGQHLLSMMMNVILDDEYRLRSCAGLSSIVDIGANIGVFSLHASTLFPAATVHAYEPDPRNIENLRFNLTGTNVAVHEEAVSNRNGNLHLSCIEDRTSTRLLEGGPSNSELLPIPVVSFDRVLERVPNGAISFLKLDCEGSEYEILEQKGIERCQTIAGELHPTGGRHPRDAVEMLIRKNFELREYRHFADEKAIFFAVRA